MTLIGVCGGMGNDIKESYLQNCHKPFDQCAKSLIKNHVQLLCGGVKTGCLGLFVEIFHHYGGQVHSIITKDEQSYRHPQIIPEIIFDHYDQRQDYIFDHAHEFLFLPGGLGTFHELFSFLLARKEKSIFKKFFVLNIQGFWSPANQLLKNAVDWNCVTECSILNFPTEI